jgi:hypothetical protein
MKNLKKVTERDPEIKNFLLNPFIVKVAYLSYKDSDARELINLTDTD